MFLRKTLPVTAAVVLGVGAGVGAAFAHDATSSDRSEAPSSPAVSTHAQGKTPPQVPADEAIPAEEQDPPTRAPSGNEKVTIADGKGGERTDMTYDEFLAETNRLEAAAPAKSGEEHMYGLLDNGEIGVTAVCVEVPFEELDDEDQKQLLELSTVPPASVHNCSEAPGVKWPTE